MALGTKEMEEYLRSKKTDDDRTRRIKELVREWVGQAAFNGTDLAIFKGAVVRGLVAEAAELIDAIDDAEVPAKESK